MRFGWISLVLMGCYVTDSELEAALDRDGDGFLPLQAGGDDCDETRADVNPGAAEVCGDGIDNNCDGVPDDDGVGARLWFRDVDGDGFGTAATVSACTEPEGYAPVDGDCEDSDSAINPGVDDLCDTIDQDCDGIPDDDVPLVERYRDADGDGIGTDSEVILACTDIPGFVEIAGDCDDTDDTISPVAVDLCDGIDQDCDGVVDDDAVFTQVFRDADGDGIGTSTDTVTDCQAVGGYVFLSGDCDDTDPTISPAAIDLCDGIDQDCDGVADDDVPSATYFQDLDGDGAGNSDIAVESCGLVPGFVLVDGDCDDTDDGISPLLSDGCDGIDQDCDGTVDEDAVRTLYFEDLDGDGIGSEVSVEACLIPVGFSQLSGDCDDTDDAVTPGAIDLCDGVDQDCDGAVDEDDTFQTFFRDADGDGLGTDSETLAACEGVPVGYVGSAGDCDDADAGVTIPSWFVDADGDGFGAGGRITVCVPPSGYASVDTDCDDTEPTRFPGNPEVCNTGIDEDCDDATDCRRFGITTRSGWGNGGEIRVIEDFNGDGVRDFLVQQGGNTELYFGPEWWPRAHAEIEGLCPEAVQADLNGDGLSDLFCGDSVFLAGETETGTLLPEMSVEGGALVGGLGDGALGPGVFSKHGGTFHFIPYATGSSTVSDSVATFSLEPVPMDGCRPGVESCLLFNDDIEGVAVLEDPQSGHYTFDDAVLIVPGNIEPGRVNFRVVPSEDISGDGVSDYILMVLTQTNPDLYLNAVLPGPLSPIVDQSFVENIVHISSLDQGVRFLGDFDLDGNPDWWTPGVWGGNPVTEFWFGVGYGNQPSWLTEDVFPVPDHRFLFTVEPMVYDLNSDGRMDLMFNVGVDTHEVAFGWGI